LDAISRVEGSVYYKSLANLVDYATRRAS